MDPDTANRLIGEATRHIEAGQYGLARATIEPTFPG